MFNLLEIGLGAFLKKDEMSSWKVSYPMSVVKTKFERGSPAHLYSCWSGFLQNRLLGKRKKRGNGERKRDEGKINAKGANIIL